MCSYSSNFYIELIIFKAGPEGEEPPTREEEEEEEGEKMQANPSYLAMSNRSEASTAPTRAEEVGVPAMQANPSYQSSVTTSYKSQEGTVPAREDEVQMQADPEDIDIYEPIPE